MRRRRRGEEEVERGRGEGGGRRRRWRVGGENTCFVVMMITSEALEASFLKSYGYLIIPTITQQ